MAGIQRLLEIMARLRDPDGGCPWDLEQDFDTLAPFTIEEAYEVDEAIARGDPEAIRDELGDLLFQVVFHARVAEEEALFDFEGVVEAIVDKLVRRHPHVFGGAETPDSAEAQSASWEAMKAAERAAAAAEETGPADPFAGIPRQLPALARSAKVAGRIERAEAGAVAPDRVSSRSVIEQTLDRLDVGPEDPTTARTLVGTGLQAWVALARAAGVDPEQALREADDAAMARVRAADASEASETPDGSQGSEGSKAPGDGDRPGAANAHQDGNPDAR